MVIIGVLVAEQRRRRREQRFKAFSDDKACDDDFVVEKETEANMFVRQRERAMRGFLQQFCEIFSVKFGCQKREKDEHIWICF